MADCCAELRSELAALRAEVAKLGKIDEESIINKAINRAQQLLSPEIAAVSVVAFGAVKSSKIALDVSNQSTGLYKVLEGKVKFLGNGLENIRDVTNALGTKVNTVNKVANSAKVATDSLGRTVIDQSSRLGNVGNAVANLDIKMAGALSSVAALNATVNSALARLAPLFNILGLVGALAGLAAIAGIIYAVFPRLDAHDYELQSIQSQLAKDSSAIFNLTTRARNAEMAISNAQSSADIASRQALDALRQGLNATYSAATAQDTASLALSRANNAQRTASDAQNRANEAISNANIAQNKANNAINTAKIAQDRANESIAKANDAILNANNVRGIATDAIAKANNAQNKANDAIAKANNAQNKANNAIAKANNLINEVALLKPQINAVTAKGNQVDQRLKQQEIVNEQGLKSIQQLPKIIEPTIINSVVNTVNAVVPKSIEQASAEIKKTFSDISASNAKALEPQFQKTIDANRAEITQLNNTVTKGFQETKIPAPVIVQPSQPTIKPGEPTNKDLQNQIGLAVGGLTVLLAGVTAALKPIANNTSPSSLQNAAAAGVCRTTLPGGCTSNLVNNVANNAVNTLKNSFGNILNTANAAANALQLAALSKIQQGVNLANTKLGPLMRGANGIGGALSRVSSAMGVDRALNLIAIASNLHNAMMLSANLKITLLEVLSSVGNATGILETPDGDNVDLNSVFNQGIEKFVTLLIGVDNYAGLKVGFRKYNAIYRAATNSLNAISSMFNSLGEAVETAAEYTGKIGNALRAASVVRENAYNFMSEKISVKSSRFMTFQTKIGDVTQVLETINEIAENVIEGQEQYTEAVKATNDFKTALANADRPETIDNKLIKEEAEKIKANLVKDPTGEDETGLLSFLTD